MWRWIVSVAFIAAIAWCAPSAASEPVLGSSLSNSGAGLLDLSRLSQSSEMSFFYGGGSGLRDQYGGLYLSHFSYRFSSPLTMRLSLGARFDNASGAFDETNGRPFVGGFQLAYQPSKSFLIRFDYVDGRALTPASYDPFGYRGSWLRD